MWSQCRKCGAGEVSVGKWQPPKQVGKGKGVLPSNMVPVNIQTEMVAVYGADVKSFQQLQKWGDCKWSGECHNEDKRGHPSENVYNQQHGAEGHVSLKQSTGIRPV